MSGLIAVPVDGSPLSESVAPLAIMLARGLNASVAFLMVKEQDEPNLLERLTGAAADAFAQESDRYYEEYLGGLKRQAEGLTVETVVKFGEPAEEILQFAESRGASYIVMATHGRSGLSRWRYGSVADKVLHASTIPLLAVGPRALEEHKVTTISHIAVPLDGSPMAEAALPYAAELAKSLGARVSLIRAVRWAAQAYPYALPEAYVPAFTEVDAAMEEEAKAYLRGVQSKLQGVNVAQAVVTRGVIVEGIIEFCEQQGVDLVVMTTHARSGLARAALGSVADRVLNGPAPVLLIRPTEEVS